MTQEELDKIVEQHQHWIKEDCEGWEGMRANLTGANLVDANLTRANLTGANLTGANLMRAKLTGANLAVAYLTNANLTGANFTDANLVDAYLTNANLTGANLTDANLTRANLTGANLARANLTDANLTRANLTGANLTRANLTGANLAGANLTNAYLTNAYLTNANQFRLGKVLDEPLTGYKNTKEGVVITAEIPAGAIVFCINGSKCRTNKAKITDMAGHEILHSHYDNRFEYRLGQEINIKDFNLMYNVECASGFHFFRTRKEAEAY